MIHRLLAVIASLSQVQEFARLHLRSSEFDKLRVFDLSSFRERFLIFDSRYGSCLKCFSNDDRQLWQSLGNYGWATMKPLRQLWDFLGNIGDFHGCFRNSSLINIRQL